MIDFLPLAIIRSIINPCILHFKDRSHEKDAPAHFYLVVPLLNSEHLLLIVMTSRLFNKISFYENKPLGNQAIECLVNVDREWFDFINRDTVLECNRARLVSSAEMGGIIDTSVPIKIICDEKSIPTKLIMNALDAVNNSPMQNNKMKSAVRNHLLEMQQ